jgi:hypothetical protein
MKKLVFLIIVTLCQGCSYNDLSHGEQFVVETVVPEVVPKLMDLGLEAGASVSELYDDLKVINSDDQKNPHPDWPMVKCFGRIVHVNNC